MKIIIGLLIVYLLFPFLGLFNYDGFGGKVTEEFKILYFIHIFIEVSIVMFFAYIFSKKRINYQYFVCFDFKKLSKISIVLLILLIIINLFIFGNYKILLGNIGRGEFRTTLHLGFIYILTSFFLPGMIVSLNAFIYSSLPLIYRKFFRKHIIIIFILAVAIGFLTGFKSTGIFIAIMGLIGLNSILKFKNLLIIGIVFILIMALSGYLFMNFANFGQVFYYLLKRATSIAVDGTVGVLNNFPNGGSDSYMILLYNLGNKLASLVSGYSTNTLNYLHIDLGRYIAYLTYPVSLKGEALSGAFNLTITNFGESIYLFGKNYFILYSLFISIFISMLLYLFNVAKLPLKNTLVVYFITSVVIGGGKITNIFSLPVLFDLLIVYICTKLLLRYSKREYVYDKKYNNNYVLQVK